MQCHATTNSFIVLLTAIALLLVPPMLSAEPRFSPPSIAVHVATARQVTQQPALRAIGTLVANHATVIKPGTSGHVTHIFFKQGSFVQKNALLIQLDKEPLQSQLEQHLAELTLSKLDYHRNKLLLSHKAVAPSQFDTAKAMLALNQAKVKEIQQQLAKKAVRAPFSGQLGLRLINLGDFIAVDQAIVSLVDTNPMWVDFTLPEIYAAKLATGQRITVHSQLFSPHHFTGKVRALDAQINPQNRSLKVRATIPNPHHRLIPGASVEVLIPQISQQALISIPQEAVVKSIKGDYVYLIKHNHAIKTAVLIASRQSRQVLISTGLKPGDQIVTDGQLKLYDGAAVIIDKAKKAQEHHEFH